MADTRTTRERVLEARLELEQRRGDDLAELASNQAVQIQNMTEEIERLRELTTIPAAHEEDADEPAHAPGA